MPIPAEEVAGRLYERYARRVFVFARGRLRTHEEAEDAVQTTFLYAFRSLQRGIVPRHELAWLLTIAENVCRGRQRSARRRHGHESPVDPVVFDGVSAPASASDELFALPDALAAMPASQRRALLLREWRGLSYQEIGDELGVSHSAVEALLFRARRSLAARLERAFKPVLGPIGFLRTVLSGGAAKVAVAVAVVGGSALVATPPSQQGRERANPAARLVGAAATRRAAGPAAAAVRSSRPGSSAGTRLSRTTGRTALGGAGAVHGVRAAPAVTATTTAPAARPAAPGEPAVPAGEAGPEAAPAPPGSSAPASPSAPTPPASRGAVDASVSTSDDGGSLPATTVDASATTPVGTVDVDAGVDPDAPDPLDVGVTAPPVPPPPALPPPLP